MTLSKTTRKRSSRPQTHTKKPSSRRKPTKNAIFRGKVPRKSVDPKKTRVKKTPRTAQTRASGAMRGFTIESVPPGTPKKPEPPYIIVMGREQQGWQWEHIKWLGRYENDVAIITKLEHPWDRWSWSIKWTSLHNYATTARRAKQDCYRAARRLAETLITGVKYEMV